MSADLHDALVTVARARGTSMNDAGCDAIHQFVLAKGEWAGVQTSLLRTGKRYVEALARLSADPPKPRRNPRRWP